MWGQALLLGYTRPHKANEVYVSEQVVKRLDSLKAGNPSLHWSAPYLASDYINQTVDAACQNILQGCCWRPWWCCCSSAGAGPR